ncbi:uncharacterized protein LOC143298937 isoform X2 [Babylonia areolata]|uniref:uncharacterized protein LOC143298937 isoform X2 n=1 Tax=Babylonia areolata TaxID=304850 RepID=UPI003FD31C35
MEVDSSSSSSRRKSMPLKVKLTLGTKGEIKVNGDKKDEDVDLNSDAESDNSDIPELPEGTIVVQPEPVEEEKIEFTGPEFKPTKKPGGAGGGTVCTKLENLFCTACGRQINPWKSGMVKKHKVLRVITCRKCYIFVGSGKITQDEDGMDEQCRWCGEGGRLTVCDKCPRAFCKSCIMRNFGRAAFTTVTESETWDCYICNPEPLVELRKHTRHVFATIKAVNGKKSKSSELPAANDDSSKPPPPPKPSAKAPKKETSANGKQDVNDDVGEGSDKNEKTKNHSKTKVEKGPGKNTNKVKDIKEEVDSDMESEKTTKSKKQSKSQKKVEDSEEEDDKLEEKKTKRAIKKEQVENGFSVSVVKKEKVEEAAKDLDSSEEDEILDRDIDSLLEESESGMGLKTYDDSDDNVKEEPSSKREPSKKKKKAGKADRKGKKGGKKKGDDSSDMSDEDAQGEDEDVKDKTVEEVAKPKKRGRPRKIKKSNSDDDAADKAADEENGDGADISGSESAYVAKKRKGRKASTDQKKGKKSKKEVEEGESDAEPEDGKRKRNRGKVAKTESLDSDSDIEVKSKRKRKKKDSDDESFSEEKSSGEEEEEDEEEEEGDSCVDSDEVGEGGDGDVSDEPGTEKKKKGRGKGKRGKGKGKEKGKKRKRIKKSKDSSSDEEPVEPVEEGEDPTSRKKIRKIKSDKKLGDTTKAAARAEEERRQRVKEKQEKFNGVEQKDMGKGQAPMTLKLVLEQDEETKDPIIQINTKLVRKLKPHQVEAVQFMWDCMFESLERSKKEEASAGCILAHCMGLGKTLSVVAFVHTMMVHRELTGVKTCLVVSPLNTVLNWMNEFDIWLDEDDKLEVWEMASVKQNLARSQVLDDWSKKGGIMIIGYEMLRNLSQGSRCRNKKQKAIFHKTLIDPGPDIVVCDEGHIMKNAASALSKAMSQIKTRRRVVLTGTPLQNNLIEYHCMVDFVKPNLLGTKKEFANRFVNPITNGQHSDSTPRDVRIMKNRAHILHELLAGCVQRRDYSSLTKFLPPKQEYVISVRLSEVQIKLYEEYLKRNGQVEGQITTRGAQLFKDYQNLMKIWTHPWVLKLAEIRDESKMKYDDEDSFIDDDASDEEKSFGSDDSSSNESETPAKAASEDESAGEGTSAGRRSRRLRNRNQSGDKDEIVKDWKTRSRGGEGDDWPVDLDLPQAVSDEWWAEYVKEEDQNKMEHSGKLVLLFDILRMCEEIGDKVLIFSQSLLSLDIIEYFLEHVDSKFTAETQDKPEEELKEEFGKRWTKGEDYFRLDGSTSAQMRQHWAGVFNDPENHRSRLFLISTRAGGLGINLVGANRVIIFDASWNPSHDVQSIFRVYRFGQVKPCYIYRFMAQGTMEEKIYDRQVTKLSLSQRVVDEHQVERHFTAADLAELYAFKPDHLSDKDEEETLMLPKDVLLAEIVSGDQKDWFVALHEHDSLLENLVEQELTEEEKKAAWEEYENEKKGLRMNVSPMGQGGFGLGNYLSQEFLLQTARDLRERNPDMPQEVLQMHLQRIIMMQIRQRQEEQRRMEMLQRQQFMQMQQHYAQLQQQYLQQMGGGGGGEGGGMFPNAMMHMAPGQRFSPSLYAHMAMPGLSAFHGGVAAAAAMGSGGSGSSPGNSGGSSSKAGTSKEASTPSPSSSSEMTEKDKSKE